MIERVLALPDQLRDALWRIEGAHLRPVDGIVAAYVCGMGGSAIGADLAAGALGDRLSKPLFAVRGYELPSWATPQSIVLCSSYSGDTEETLACYSAAEALGAVRIVATTGGALAEAARADGVPVIGLPAGFAARAAVAYMFCAAAEVAMLAGAAPGLRTEVDSAAAHLESRREELVALADELAGHLAGAAVIVYGSGLTAPVASRWKAQLNENAKLPAFASVLPEADHNEIVGWAGAAAGSFAAVFLEDRDQHPRERRRIEWTADLIREHATDVVRIETEGTTRTERLLEAVMLGDLLSLALADRRGVDPEATVAIDTLKRKLAE